MRHGGFQWAGPRERYTTNTHKSKFAFFSFFLFLTCCICIRPGGCCQCLSSVSSSWALTLMRHAVECDGYFVHIETVTRQRRKGNKKCGLLVFVTVKQDLVQKMAVRRIHGYGAKEISQQQCYTSIFLFCWTVWVAGLLYTYIYYIYSMDVRAD